MKNNKIKLIEIYVKGKLKNEKSGHDFEHVKRVLRNALKISENYKVDKEVLILSCLLHDIGFQNGYVKNHDVVGSNEAKKILKKFNYSEEKIKKVCSAISNHCRNLRRFSKEKIKSLPIEDNILADADNLDAFGAIGLIRQINFCSENKIPFFKSKNDKLNDSVYGGMKTIINWVDKIYIFEARKIAKQRIKIMKFFIKQIEKEVL